jgi:hypothetical protein
MGCSAIEEEEEEEEYLARSTSYEAPHYAFSPSLFSPNIPLSTLFLNTLRLCFYLHVRDQVSHP